MVLILIPVDLELLVVNVPILLAIVTVFAGLKGKRMDNYICEDIMFIADWCNALPRKILGYKTSDEMFELDKIYASQFSKSVQLFIVI